MNDSNRTSRGSNNGGKERQERVQDSIFEIHKLAKSFYKGYYKLFKLSLNYIIFVCLR